MSFSIFKAVKIDRSSVDVFYRLDYTASSGFQPHLRDWLNSGSVR